jgi:NTP pyrophosphatase (non-canonical NTP hydrolase)
MIKTFDEYQEAAITMRCSLDRLRERHPDLPDDVVKLLAVAYDGLGMGEAGEVQGKIKKIIRDSGGVITDESKNSIIDELSDVMWYIASMCDNLNIRMEDVATHNIEKLRSRQARGVIHGSGDNR